MDDEQIREKAVSAMKAELDSDVEESDEGMESEQQEESEDDGMIKMDFSAKNKK